MARKPALTLFLLCFLATVPAAFAAGHASKKVVSGPPSEAPGLKAALRPVGSPPLSDRKAARRVRHSSWEPRPENARANRRMPSRRELKTFYANSENPYKDRVTGHFKGTTDEILQWSAHKHGLDEDLLRAVAVQESWWKMSAVGDNGDSFGLMQMRRPYHCCLPFMAKSTAFNVDYYGSIIRAYFDGKMEWLNTVERGAEYVPGDIWGSVGAWYSGRWRLPSSEPYISEVQRHMRERTWLGQWF